MTNNKEVNQETINKIVTSATALFNNKGYAGTSISDIAKNAQLSKGILYHYFDNKDQLYLHCGKKCLDDYSSYLGNNLNESLDIDETITENIKIRLRFFKDFPQYKTLFNFIILKKPEHLTKELLELRQGFKEENQKRLRARIANIKLGEGIDEQDIITFTTMIQNNASLMLQDDIDEETQQIAFERVLRMIKIFNNGLKVDLQ